MGRGKYGGLMTVEYAEFTTKNCLVFGPRTGKYFAAIWPTNVSVSEAVAVFREVGVDPNAEIYLFVGEDCLSNHYHDLPEWLYRAYLEGNAAAAGIDNFYNTPRLDFSDLTGDVLSGIDGTRELLLKIDEGRRVLWYQTPGLRNGIEIAYSDYEFNPDNLFALIERTAFNFDDGEREEIRKYTATIMGVS